MKFDEYEIPTECPKCHTSQFIPSKAGDVMCSKCGNVVAKWFDWFDSRIPIDY